MTRFSDLFWSRRDLAPADHQDYLEQKFARAVAASNLHGWTPGDPVGAAAKRYLIGVATWSEYDMRLLDLLDAALDGLNGVAVRVDVFSVQACRSAADFEAYVPGIGKVYGTPVIGVWEKGVLVEKGAGARAREELLVESFGLDWAGQRWRQGAGAL